MSQFIKENVQNLKKSINAVLEMDKSELYGENRLHQLSFRQHGQDQFQMVFSLIRDLEKCHFERVPDHYILNIQHSLNTYKNIFEKAKKLNITDGGDIKIARDQIVTEAEQSYQTLFDAVSPVIGFVNQAGTDFKKIEEDARRNLDKMSIYFDETKKQINNKKEEVDSVLRSIRKASAEAGVSQEAVHFSEAQKTHAKNADKWYKWGKGLLIGLTITLSVVGLAFWKLNENPTTISLGYLEFTILAIISLWVYSINFCNKNFHAEKHNEISNSSKAKTLATFRSFVDATKEEHIKDQVLVQASTSVFTSSPTGFGKHQIGPLPLPVEVGKQIVSRSNGST